MITKHIDRFIEVWPGDWLVAGFSVASLLPVTHIFLRFPAYVVEYARRPAGHGSLFFCYLFLYCFITLWHRFASLFCCFFRTLFHWFFFRFALVCARQPWIRISCNTSVLVVEQIQEQNTWRFVAKCFSWSMVQLILNPAYLPITDVTEIGLFREVLPDESVAILNDRFLPGMVGMTGLVSAFNGLVILVCW